MGCGQAQRTAEEEDRLAERGKDEQRDGMSKWTKEASQLSKSRFRVKQSKS